MRGFLGINYIMSINKLTTMLWLDRDLKTFYEISIFRATQKMPKATKVTKSDLLSTILTRKLTK